MSRPRIIAAALLATGALALAAGAFAKGTPAAAAGDDERSAVIAVDDGDSAWVKVDRGPRLHIVTKDARRDEPSVIDIDLSNLGQVIAEAMQEVSRSLENLDIRTEGPKGQERLIINADGKETVVDLAQIMRDVNREVSHAMREVDRSRDRIHRHAERGPAGGIGEDRRALRSERAELQAEMDALRQEMSALRDEIGKLREQEQRHD